MSRRYLAAAICTPGLEPVVTGELAEQRIEGRTVAPGVVEFKGSTRQVYWATAWLRSANRVLVRIDSFRATTFDGLRHVAADTNWDQLIDRSGGVDIRVSSRSSKLYHTDAIAERLHEVIGPPPEPGSDPTAHLSVRVDNNRVTISRDAAGVPLMHRSWRTERGPAPLRPTMAAAVLLAAKYRGTQPLVDPFAGSGTIAIEAALIASGQRPDPERRFGFERWPDFEPGTWASVNGGRAASEAEPASIEAYDRDEGATAQTIGNAKRAGVGHLIDARTEVVGRLPGRPGSGVVVTNPPYGKRLGREVAPLWKRLGAVVRERRPGWELVMVGPDQKLARAAAGRAEPLLGFGHGGSSVTAWKAEPKETSKAAQNATPTQ